MITRNATLIVPLILFACGCHSGSYQMYDGPPRPAGQVASLQNQYGVRLRSVDGRRVEGGSWDGSAYIELLPGEHQVEVAYHRESTDAWGTQIYDADPVVVKFTATGGQDYYVATGNISYLPGVMGRYRAERWRPEVWLIGEEPSEAIRQSLRKKADKHRAQAALASQSAHDGGQ